MVWALFERFSLEMWRAGRSHYGAKGVMERVRWETVAGGGDPFKISNDHVAFYARRFMRDHPEVGSFFRLKEQTSANRAPIGGE